MRGFRKIEAWQLADDLVVAVYEATKGFPKDEVYGITSQIRRAATSVAANIVEGAARESAKDSAHFLQIARGSLAETQYFSTSRDGSVTCSRSTRLNLSKQHGGSSDVFTD
jgi:four helix bundle protein